MAVVAQMPSASVNTAIAVKPGFFNNVRAPWRRFRRRSPSIVLLLFSTTSNVGQTISLPRPLYSATRKDLGKLTLMVRSNRNLVQADDEADDHKFQTRS